MFDIEKLAAVDPTADEAALVQRIAALERVKAAAAAGQARATASLDQRRSAAGLPRAKQCRGLASEVALARRDSPARGNRHLGFAKALVHEMPLRPCKNGVAGGDGVAIPVLSEGTGRVHRVA